jgi:SAM-dependent methyltransferase
MAGLISKNSGRKIFLHELLIPEKFASKEEYLFYLRHLFAYEFSKKNISSKRFVLEVGCGEGYGTSLLSQYVIKIIGLDVDKDIVAHASKKYGSKNCIFRLYDGVIIPYNDDTFDAVISFQVIEHIQDDVNYVSEIYRVLKRDGIFILTTPNRTNRLKPGQNPWNKTHVREYYPHELENNLRTRFSNVKIWGIRGNEEVQGIEIARIERIRKALEIIYLLDPLKLRKLIPESLKPLIIKILQRIIHRSQKGENGDFLTQYSLKDYYVIKNDVKDSLDILGICQK